MAIILGTVPLAMVGSIWLMYLEGFNFSVAVGVGFIALVGVAVEIGVIMLVYLNQEYKKMLERCRNDNTRPSLENLTNVVLNAAALRVRPVMMTALTIIIGLLPILYVSGTADYASLSKIYIGLLIPSNYSVPTYSIDCRKTSMTPQAFKAPQKHVGTKVYVVGGASAPSCWVLSG